MPEWPGQIGDVLLSQDQIRQRVTAMGEQLTHDYHGKRPLFVCVLQGAAVFHADLIRAVRLQLRIDFVSISTYGSATESSGEVRVQKDLDTSIRGRHVLLVEDIVDTGLSLSYLLSSFQNRKPRSLKVCALLSKPDRRKIEVPVDYLGFEIPDRFVVGYGLDFNQLYRNLPFISILAEAL